MDIPKLLVEIGSSGMDYLGLPIIIWTLMSLMVLGLMRYSGKVDAAFQYHGRIALLFILPAGLAAAAINRWLSGLAEAGNGIAAKFLVIQSPITISASSSVQNGPDFLGNPAFWGGMLIMFAIATGLLLICKIGYDVISLSIFEQKLSKEFLTSNRRVSARNIQIAHDLKPPIRIAFSGKVEVPFTFGWLKPVIVLPESFQSDSEDKLNLAIRHELMHIKHHDYALNTLMMIIRAIFWFHPVVHQLYKGFKEYREISCDSEVLADDAICRKSYARLLFELASKKTFSNTPAVSMAVNASTLKKRIHIMSKNKHQNNSFKAGFYIMLCFTVSMTGIMACTDIQDNGITNSEVESAQSQMATVSQDNSPLYVIDGEVVKDQEIKRKLSFIKTKYIESLNVLKGEKAIEKYGEDGKNGVIEFKLLDREMAFNDLKPPPAPVSDSPKASKKEGDDYFVVVEEMPKLKGGLQSIMNKVQYPEEARKAGIEGRVIVQFIVNEQGKVVNPTVIKGIGSGADEEALRVVKEAEFTPGMQNDKPVRVQYSLPIIFKLGDSST